jgi:hypothetical protein
LLCSSGLLRLLLPQPRHRHPYRLHRRSYSEGGAWACPQGPAHQCKIRGGRGSSGKGENTIKKRGGGGGGAVKIFWDMGAVGLLLYARYNFLRHERQVFFSCTRMTNFVVCTWREAW